MMPLFLLSYITEEEDFIKSLPSDKKFMLLLELIRKGVIKDQAQFAKSLTFVGMSTNEFLDTMEDLWNRKKIGWEEIDLLDKHPVMVDGPGLLSDRILNFRLGADSICKRIPPRYHDSIPLCKELNKK